MLSAQLLGYFRRIDERQAALAVEEAKELEKTTLTSADVSNCLNEYFKKLINNRKEVC